MSAAMGSGASSSQFADEIEQDTGLQVPEDFETLLGDSTTFAVGGDIDYKDLVNSSDGSHVPIGAVVFSADGVDLPTVTAPPWTATWSAPSTAASRTVALTVRATDQRGNASAAAPLSITVDPASAKPFVHVVSPTEGQTFVEGAVIAVSVSA